MIAPRAAGMARPMAGECVDAVHVALTPRIPRPCASPFPTRPLTPFLHIFPFIAARPTARCLSLRVQASAADGAGVPSHLVANLLVQKEEELKQMIAPGRLAPRAAVIAGLRKEIAALRGQLKSAVAANLPPTLAADLPAPPAPEPTIPSSATTISYASASMSVTRTTIKSSTDRRGRTTGTAAREALLLIEQQLSVASGGDVTISGSDMLAARGRSALQAVEQSLSMGVASAAVNEEMAQLEALLQENALLKARFEALTERQRQLAVLKERVASEKVAAAVEAPAAAPKRRGRKPAAPKAEGEEGAAEKKPRARRTTKKAAVEGGAEGEEKKPVRRRRTVAAKKDADPDAGEKSADA
jgi:hypothetical protein